MEHSNKTQEMDSATWFAAPPPIASPEEPQFKRFRELPEDIRFEIWKHAMRAHRIIEVEVFKTLHPQTLPMVDWNQSFDIRFKEIGHAADDCRAISELMFCEEPAGHGTRRLMNNKMIVEPSETTFLISNFMAFWKKALHLQGSSVSFSILENVRTLAFYVLENEYTTEYKHMSWLCMWEFMTQIMTNIKQLEKIYLVLDIDKYIDLQARSGIKRGFISGHTGLIESRSSGSARLKLYEDAKLRNTMMDCFAQASKIKQKLEAQMPGVTIKIVQWELKRMRG